MNAAFFAGEPTLEGTYLAAEMWRAVATNDVFPKGRLHGSWRFVERREAVYPIEGLRRLVSSFLRFDRLEDSLVPLTVVVTRLDDGVEEWLTEGPALEAVLASAALRYAHDFAGTLPLSPQASTSSYWSSSASRRSCGRTSRTPRSCSKGATSTRGSCSIGSRGRSPNEVGRAQPRDGGPVRAGVRRSREESLVRTVRLD